MCHVALLNLPGTDRGVPPAVELAALNVKRDGNELVQIARVLFDAVLSEYFEMHLAGILVKGFQHIRLYFPRVTIAADALLCGQYLNYLTYNFHCNCEF